jgi:putative endonuclease
MKTFYVYIMASLSGILYIGYTNRLDERVRAHKSKHFQGSFSARYNVNRLVWYEEHGFAMNAITREKQIKKWNREWKMKLIESLNPGWNDLSEDWLERNPK